MAIVTRWAAVAITAGLVIAGCASVDVDEPPGSPSADVPAETSTPTVTAPGPSSGPSLGPSPSATASPDPSTTELPPVPEQLQFEATLLADGAAFDGASLAGQDALVWIWAPWCPVCQAEAPEVRAAVAELPEGVAMYGLAGNADAVSSQAFVEEYGLGDFPHIFSEDGSVWEKFGITYQPALVIIGREGTVEALPGTTSTWEILNAAERLVDN